jgi:hypothetical protein
MVVALGLELPCAVSFWSQRLLPANLRAVPQRGLMGVGITTVNRPGFLSRLMAEA